MLDCLENLSGSELVALAAIFSILISQGLSAEELDTLGNFVTAVGTNLTTIASANSDTIISTNNI